jgi:hypothetical protein
MQEVAGHRHNAEAPSVMRGQRGGSPPSPQHQEKNLRRVDVALRYPRLRVPGLSWMYVIGCRRLPLVRSDVTAAGLTWGSSRQHRARRDKLEYPGVLFRLASRSEQSAARRAVGSRRRGATVRGQRRPGPVRRRRPDGVRTKTCQL